MSSAQIEAGACRLEELILGPGYGHTNEQTHQAMIGDSQSMWNAFHPVVNGVEEHKALPVGTIIMDEHGFAVRKTPTGWVADGDATTMSDQELIDGGGNTSTLLIRGTDGDGFGTG